MADEKVTTEVAGRSLGLSNLGKVLYPETGFTKAEVIDYYLRIAPVLLPHLADRTVTRVRFPNGVGGQQFFEKNPPPGAPDWLATQHVVGSETTDYVVVRDEADLVYLANLASLELHVPQWRIADAARRGRTVLLDDAHEPAVTTVVLDLDPGEGVTMVEIARAALVLATYLAGDGLVPYAKTSGSKGIQVYAPVAPTPADRAIAYVNALGKRAAAEHDSFVLVQTKAKRTGKILIDWMQNKAARTTVAPYSLRGRARPTVSTPVTWEEVGAVTEPTDLAFTAADVLARVDADGDLFADLLAGDHPELPDPA